MQNLKISDSQAMERIAEVLEQANPGSPLVAAVRRVLAAFAETPVEAEADSCVAPDALSAVGDAALRSVRLPEATVRQWEGEISRGGSTASDIE